MTTDNTIVGCLQCFFLCILQKWRSCVIVSGSDAKRWKRMQTWHMGAYRIWMKPCEYVICIHLKVKGTPNRNYSYKCAPPTLQRKDRRTYLFSIQSHDPSALCKGAATSPIGSHGPAVVAALPPLPCSSRSLTQGSWSCGIM